MNRFAARFCLVAGLALLAAVQTAPAQPKAKPKGGPKGPPPGWREYKPADSAFTVWLPQKRGQQVTETHTLRIPGSTPMKLVIVRYRPEVGPAYSAGVIHLPKILIGQVTGGKWIDMIRDAFLEDGKAKVKDKKNINLAQFPGKEFLVTGSKDTSRLRVYVSEKQVWLVVVEGQPADMDTDEANTFFGSFRVPNMDVADLAPQTKEKERPKGDVLDAATIDKLVEALKSADTKARQEAAEKLAQAAPLERRELVAKALIDLMTDTNNFLLAAVKKALLVWGTKDNVPALLPLLTHENRLVRGNAMEVLAAFKDERGADGVASRLRNSADRAKASQALRDMGPVAESAVLKLIKSPDAKVRLEVCKVLEAIGTKASLPALQTAEKDSNAQVAKAAQEAAAKVAQR